MSKEVRVVANWKMNKTIPEALDFIQKMPPLLSVLSIAVPATCLHACSLAKQPMMSFGAQNIYFETDGPFTGEISAIMAIDAGADFVLLGHSERRHMFHESNEIVNRKVRRALLQKLLVIVCIGETLTEREENRAHAVLKEQLLESLNEIDPQLLSQIMIAYEPVWAIGTGLASTAQMAQETHFFLRNLIKEKWGAKVAEHIYILYGGSINPENVEELITQPDIDGVLVGGASLNPDSLLQIIQTTGKVKK